MGLIKWEITHGVNFLWRASLVNENKCDMYYTVRPRTATYESNGNRRFRPRHVVTIGCTAVAVLN